MEKHPLFLTGRPTQSARTTIKTDFRLNALTACMLSLFVAVSPSDARADTLEFLTERTEELEQTTREVQSIVVGDGVTGTVSGTGGTLIYNGGDFLLGSGEANTSRLDMSGLSHFVFDSADAELIVSGRREGLSGSGSDGVLNLAGESNVITAKKLGLATISRNVQSDSTNYGLLEMGRDNTFNIDVIEIGTNQGNGTLRFDADITDGHLRLRGSNGVDAVERIDLAPGVNSNYSHSTGTFDTRAGTLDAKVDTLHVALGQYGARNANGYFLMGAGQLDVNRVVLGEDTRTSGNGSTKAELKVSRGGVVNAGDIIMGIASGIGRVTSTLMVTEDAMVRAATILAGEGNGTREITLNAGTLANRAADENMRSDVNILLTGNGSFFSEGKEATMTIEGVVSGIGSLIKTGLGTLELTANNSYSGGTRIDEGEIAFSDAGNLGSSDITLNGGGLKWNSGNSSDLSTRLVVDARGGVLNSNGNDITFASALRGDGGPVHKTGDGTLTLLSDNSWSGTTFIEQGALQFGDGGTTGSVAGDIVNNSTLIFNRADDVVLSGTLSGDGNIVQRGSGTTILTGDVTSARGIALENGKLQIGNGGSTGNLHADVQLSAGSALLVNRADTTLLAGVISGEGAFAQNGSGTTVLTADNSWTGGTDITNGTLQLGNDGTHGSITGAINNNGILQFSRSDVYTVNNPISGSGDLVQIGSGTLVVAGDQTYSGQTRIERGTLQLDGSLRSATSVAAGGTLSGNGQIFADLNNAGTVRPGSIGATGYHALTVSGNYVGDDGLLVLNTELGGDGSPSDRLILDGGHASGTTRVAINNTGSGQVYTEKDGIRIIDAINGATSEEDAFRLASETRSGALSYRLFRGDLAKQDLESWYLRNQFIVEPEIPVDPDPITPVTPEDPEVPEDPTLPLLPEDPINPVTPPDAPRTGTTLPLTPPSSVLPAGEYPVIGPAIATYGVVQPMARELGMLTLGTRDQRSGDGAMLINGDQPRQTSFWTRLIATNIDHSWQAYAAPSAKGSVDGLQLGADLWQQSAITGHHDRLGFYVGQSRAAVSVSGLVTNDAGTQYVRTDTGKVKLNATALGLYWTHSTDDQAWLDATAQITRYRGSAESASGRLDAEGYGVITSLEAGYPFALSSLSEGFTLEPQAQLIWQQTRFKQAQDHQSSVAFGNVSGLTGRVGLRAKWHVETGSGSFVEPFVSLNYWQDWEGKATTVYDDLDRAPLASSGGRVSADAGVTTGLTQALKLYGNLGYQTSTSTSGLQDRDSYQAAVGLRYSF